MNKLEIKAQIEVYTEILNSCNETTDIALIIEQCFDEREKLEKRLETLEQLGH